MHTKKALSPKFSEKVSFNMLYTSECLQKDCFMNHKYYDYSEDTSVFCCILFISWVCSLVCNGLRHWCSSLQSEPHSHNQNGGRIASILYHLFVEPIVISLNLCHNEKWINLNTRVPFFLWLLLNTFLVD